MKVTLSKIIDAIEVGGYTQGRFHEFYHDKEETELYDACAIGQAALNLGAEIVSLRNALEMMPIAGPKSDNVYHYVSSLNDFKELGLAQIVERLRKDIKRPNRVIDVEQKNYTNFKNWQGVKVNP